MSVAAEIDRIKSKVSDAYTAVRNKGVTTSKTKIADLAGEISKIQTRKPEEEKTVDLNMASGNQVILPTDGKAMSKVTVKKPWQLAPEYIRKGFTIGGVRGTLPVYSLVKKEVIVTENGTTVYTPPEGSVYNTFTVTVNVGGSGGGGYNVYFDSEWTNFYGTGRMGTVKFLYADDTDYTSGDNNLNGASFSNVVSVTFTEMEGESWSITYEVNGSQDNFWLGSKSTETLDLTGDTTFLSFSK